MNISISDPLALLPYLTGAIKQPLKEGAAKSSTDLNSKQSAAIIGEPIPIVFCRRVSSNGGVWVSPKATEGRFQNDGNNNLAASYHLVLSEGNLPQIPLRDFYQGECSVGTWYQTYNRRAGTWTLGNFITELYYADIQFQISALPGVWINALYNDTYKYWEYQVGGTNYYWTTGVTAVRNTVGKEFKIWKCPTFCGTSGTYANLTTLSYSNQFSETNDTWERQVHCFVSNGMQVTRILDNTLGSSNNVVDLAIYLLKQSSRLPDYLIDTAAMTAAANFVNTNSFLYNGIFKDSSNLEDWLQDTAPQFLLRLSEKNGKKGLRPLLPINQNYTIKTTANTWVFGFTEDHILPGGFEIEYIPLGERKPICAQVMWRQQPEANIGIVRSTEVRFTGEALNGPFEQYDLTEFCTVENHAVKVGMYNVARRKYITHSLRIRVRPDAFNPTLSLGDIVRVKLRRETNAETVTYHDYLYETERITKTIAGVVELDLMHFPVDSQNRSLVALAVDAAVGAGYSMPSGRADFSCNINTSTSPVPDAGGNIGGLPGSGNFGYNGTPGGEGSIGGGIDNPEDPYAGNTPQGAGQITGPATLGGTLNAVPPCPGGKVYWYKTEKSTGVETLIKVDALGDGWQAGSSLSITSPDIGYILSAVARCPDPGAADGFGAPIPMGEIDPLPGPSDGSSGQFFPALPEGSFYLLTLPGYGDNGYSIGGGYMSVWEKAEGNFYNYYVSIYDEAGNSYGQNLWGYLPIGGPHGYSVASYQSGGTPIPATGIPW